MKLYNDKKWLEEQYQKFGTISKLAEMANCSVTHIGRKMKQFNLPYSSHPNSTNGRTHNSAGYILIKPDDGEKRQGSTKHGYIYEHRYIMAQHLGRELRSNEIVHHINGKRDDNRIKNLCLVQSHKSHLKFHVGLRQNTLKQKPKVLKLRKNGALILEIADQVKLSQPTILKILDEYSIVCYQCDKKFSSHKALGMHITRTHRNSKHHSS